jgi:hypothetical protein
MDMLLKFYSITADGCSARIVEYCTRVKRAEIRRGERIIARGTEGVDVGGLLLLRGRMTPTIKRPLLPCRLCAG